MFPNHPAVMLSELKKRMIRNQKAREKRQARAELMKKAGFKNRKELRAWHAKHVGAQNW